MGSCPPSSRRGFPAIGALPSCDGAAPDISPSSIARCPVVTLPTLRNTEKLHSTTKRGALIITTGVDAGRLVPIPDNELVSVGRSHECVVQIDDDCLSRVHARVARVRRRYVLADARSTNGTFRNGKLIEGVVELEDSDRLVLGRYTSLWFKLVDHNEEESLTRAYEGSSRDGLTGMFNRRYLTTALETEVALAVRKHLPLSIIMLDVDHFKNVNDRWGHLAGDSALRRLASTISHEIRASDIAARFGGEEFLIVARVTTLDEAARLAERLRRAAERCPVEWNDEWLTVTVSAGVASLACCTAEPSITGLIELADQRMYEAKRLRNRVVARSNTEGG